jgi:hypothetical protein
VDPGFCVRVHRGVEAIAQWANCPIPTHVGAGQRDAVLTADTERFKDAARAAIKRECRVLSMTTAAPLCEPPQLRDFEPATVIFDEYSMINAAQILVFAAMARRRVVCFHRPVLWDARARS